jgi:gliding motility-associated-like protein
MKKYYIFLCLLSFNIVVFSQVANFNIPDTVCVKQSITIQNTSTGGGSFYWNFCSGNLATNPLGSNLGNLGSLNNPVYSAIAKDGKAYFVFISNIRDGSITRLAFGNSLTNTPIATNLGNLGVMGLYIEGIQIKKDNLTGNWIGLVSWGQVDNLVRLNFGNSLNNIPTAENLGNIGNLMRYAHTIYTFSEGGNWYSFVVNHDPSSIIRLNFGNSLTNFPTVTDLGNIGGLNGSVGLYPIEENGIWYMFIINRDNNTLSRLNFGSSLLNTPTGVNLGDVGSTMNFPRSITILKDCGKIFGFVVNEGSNDIIRLSFPNGLLSTPIGTSLRNIANFSFPHHISELFRVGDSLYAFIMNVDNSTISRLCFPSCNNSSIPSSNIQNPPSYSYNSPGRYNVSLVINEGLPSQSNLCKEVTVIVPLIPVVTGDTSLCAGESLNLISSASPGSTYLWTGPNGYSSASQNLTISNIDVNNSGKYTLTTTGGCSNVAVSKIVSVIEGPKVTGDTTLCPGESLNLISTVVPGNTYHWTGPNGYISTSQNLIIPAVNSYNAGKYTLTVSGCANIAVNMNVSVVNNPIINGDTTICVGETLQLNSVATPGNSYLWMGPDGFSSTSQNLTIPHVSVNNAGKYTLTVNSCANIAVDKIVIVNEVPTITGDTAICVGDTLNLNSSTTPGNSYLWTGPNGFSSTKQNLTILNFNESQAGRYSLSVSGCENAAVSKIVSIAPGPIVNLGNDTIICQGSVIFLNAGNIGMNYQWNTGENSQTIPVATSGTYSVIVSDGSCIGSDEVFIDNCGSELWFPNVFTPNDDGINDRFRPVSLRTIGSYRIIIYNRWGQWLYESKDALIGWDGIFEGTKCPDGVYYYVAEYSFGRQFPSLDQKVKRGAVTILR